MTLTFYDDPMPDATAVLESTRDWLEAFVIGLNLCPFARRVYDAGRIRYVVAEAVDEAGLTAELARELKRLAETPREKVETTLLIHPQVLADFLDFNDYLAVADDVLAELGLAGTIQIASFHPRYQFAGTEPDDVENFTNRSPYPMLHLLREVSVTEVAGKDEFVQGIPQRNIALLRQLGRAGLPGCVPGS